jgi:hypothetical protein
MLSVKDRSIWLRVGAGVETLSGMGRAVWNEPAAVRNALREMLSVLPATHLQIDLGSLRCRMDPPAQWKVLLARGDGFGELLGEMVQAIGDAVRGRAEWGIGFPGPAVVADSLGDVSERGVLKAGLQLASFLQGLREAGIGFVALDLLGAPVPQKTLAPFFRNAEMYKWRRAAICSEDAPIAGADVRLVEALPYEALLARWQAGELVGGGLGAAFWSGEPLPQPAPARALLYGEVPLGVEAAAIVAAGRGLSSWLG